MKKAFYTIGLFSMVLVLTSFTNSNEPGGQVIPMGTGTGLDINNITINQIDDNFVVGQQLPLSENVL